MVDATTSVGELREPGGVDLRTALADDRHEAGVKAVEDRLHDPTLLGRRAAEGREEVLVLARLEGLVLTPIFPSRPSRLKFIMITPIEPVMVVGWATIRSAAQAT